MARLPLLLALCAPLYGCLFPHPCACDDDGQVPYGGIAMNADGALHLTGWSCGVTRLSREATLDTGLIPFAEGPALRVDITRMDDGEERAYEIPLSSSYDGHSLPSDVALGGFEGCAHGMSVSVSLIPPAGCEDDMPGGYETVGFQLLAEDSEDLSVPLWDDWSVDVGWFHGGGVCGGGFRRGPRGSTRHR